MTIHDDVILTAADACRGTYMQEETRANADRVKLGKCVVAEFQPTERDFDWAVKCPGCGKTVVGDGQSPWAECLTCNGRVFVMNGLAVLV